MMNDANIIIAIVSVGVACASAIIGGCALWVSMRADKRNEKQARLSVLPRLDQSVIMDMLDGSGYYEFKIINKGLGPAIIKEWVLSFEGKEVSRGDSLAYNKFWFDKMGKFRNAKVDFISPNSAMEKGEDRLMWSFNFDHKNDDIRFIHKIDLWIKYESIYGGKNFFYDSKDSHKFIGK